MYHHLIHGLMITGRDLPVLNEDGNLIPDSDASKGSSVTDSFSYSEVFLLNTM